MKNLVYLVVAAFIFLVTMETHAGECQEHNWDIYKVGKARQQGLSKQAILAHMESARHELTPERMEKIRAMIDQVYALEPGQEQVWFEKNRLECKPESDA